MAVQDPTTNYSWDLPTNNGDAGAWGNKLRTIIGDDSTGIDAVVQAVSDVADAAMPKAGGTFTGEVKVLELNQTVVNKGTTSGAVAFDYSAGGYQYITINGNVTATLTNPPTSGTFGFLRLELNSTAAGGTNTITWPASVSWSAAAGPPIPSSAGPLTVELMTRDGGTTWLGRVTGY